jgi:DNA-directed RNA polymerase specialized sigma subunit
MTYKKKGYYWQKLSDEDVLDIRKRFKNGEKQTDIAKLYNTSQTHVSQICSRIKRANVPE